jgi:hydroxymethylbilane synthase
VDAPVDQLEGQGWFTAELERSLLDGRADAAVHSAKDLPSALAAGLGIAAYLPRADARDGVVSATGERLDQLPAGATVGTSSARRAGLLAGLYPGLRVVPIRGNVDTRLRKLDAGDFDALLLACAGLDRLGLGERFTERLDPVQFVPSPAQGAIAIETVTGSAAARACELIDTRDTRIAVTAERAVLSALGGGCLLPLGAWARIEDGRLLLVAALVVEGSIRRAEAEGSPDAPEALGGMVAARLR